MFARSCLEEGEEGRFTASKLSDSSPHQPGPHFYLEIEKDSLIRSRLLGSYNVGVVEHEAPADQFCYGVPGSLEEGHVAPHVGHHGGDYGGEGLHRGELLDPAGEGEGPVADTGDVEVVGQGQAALVEHQVHDGHVKALPGQEVNVVWVKNCPAILRHQQPDNLGLSNLTW